MGLIYSCQKSISINSKADVAPTLPAEAANYTEGMVPITVSLNNTGMPNNSANNGNAQMRISIAEFQKNNFNGGFNGGVSNQNNTSTIPTITNHGATLGRVLFYDTKLSLNNTVSCASCHHQDKAFTDGQALSAGFEGRITSRSAMAICNPITQNNLFWDSRSSNVKDLVLRPVQNHVEMGMDNMDRLVAKLNKTTYYQNLFNNAFGSSEITADKIADALSMFVASITTSDRVNTRDVAGQPLATFTALEQTGHNLFQQNCASCHSGANLIADDGPSGGYGGGSSNGIFGSNSDKKGATNIGLDLNYADNGVGDGNFKIPSLRNIMLTAPYMHDGRFKSLNEVLNFYTSGIKNHTHLDTKFKSVNGGVQRIVLSSIEKEAVIAFLKTLTDTKMTTDPKFSNPFKY
jgi:cytochrome c peroxidase